MDKIDQTNNIIRESFENQLPDEQLPNFIWDNIVNELNAAPTNTVAESTEKVKSSFEQGFEAATLPEFVWEDVLGELDATPTLDADLTMTNKIKTSFEANFQDKLPERLWDTVENKLEIETVWERVHKALNIRTKKRYWQEKGIQLSLVCLALLWLRGCDFGTTFTNNSPVYLPSQAVESAEAKPNNSLANTNTKPQNLSPTASLKTKEGDSKPNHAPFSSPNAANGIANKEEKAKNFPTSITNNEVPTEPSPFVLGQESKAKDKKPSDVEQPTVFEVANAKTNNKLPVIAAKDNHPNHPNHSEPSEPPIIIKKEPKINNSSEPNTLAKTAAIIKTNKTEPSPTKSKEPNNLVVINNNVNNNNVNNNATTTPKNAPNNTVLTTANPKTTNNKVEIETPFVKKEWPQNTVPTLVGGTIADSAIYTLRDFHIENVDPKKKSSIHFEIGLIGKMGTSLLLGQATDKAMETTSMLKTKIRPSGGLGVQFNCFLTRNDAIVLAAYPFSMSQQYFGGYTKEGHFYHKEIKLAYFDFTLGYQRTLLRYNEFGPMPSTVYARVAYGLGYLNKGEEIVNGEILESSSSYKTLNHSVGLAIGNTHQIKRFMIDYGVNASVGVTSVLNNNSTTPVMEESHLMKMGGYVGLRYML